MGYKKHKHVNVSMKCPRCDEISSQSIRVKEHKCVECGFEWNYNTSIITYGIKSRLRQ